MSPAPAAGAADMPHETPDPDTALAPWSPPTAAAAVTALTLLRSGEAAPEALAAPVEATRGRHACGADDCGRLAS